MEPHPLSAPYLFVGEDEQNCFSELVFVEHSEQLLSRFSYTFPVVAVHDEDKTLLGRERAVTLCPFQHQAAALSQFRGGETLARHFMHVQIRAVGGVQPNRKTRTLCVLEVVAP